MSAPQVYPQMPPAGQFPQQGAYGYQNQSYAPPQQYGYQQSFQQNPPYPTQNPPYPQQFPGERPAPPYPQQFPGESPSYPQQQSYPPQQQSFQPAPPHAGGFHSHPPAQTWDPQQVWQEQNGVSAYNNPSQPMYGKTPGAASDFDQLSRSGDPNQMQPGQDGERGLGATLLGGAGGAFLGHKMEHGALGTLGGLAIGAIAANAFEHHEKKKKEERRDVRGYDDGYDAGERRHSRSGSRSRDIDDDRDRDSYYQYDRYRDYEDDEYEPPRHHHHHHHYEDDDGYYQPDDYDQDYRREEYDRY